MLRFYWPISVIVLFVGILVGVHFERIMAIAALVEFLSMFYFIARIKKNVEIEPRSLLGFIVTQYDLGDEFKSSDLVGEGTIRLIGLFLGMFSFFYFVPSILLILYSSARIDDSLV
jgi:hypothetical protein